MAPISAEGYSALVQRGGLRLKRGRVKSVEVGDGTARVVIQDRDTGSSETLQVQRVIYATGTGVGASTDGLVAGLIADGFARTDQHGMGLDVTETLQVIGRDGDAATARVWALGPIVRGIFWECTAVPDIRVQARMIALEVARQLAEPFP